MRDIQANILLANGRDYLFVRHLVLSVANRDAARRALGLMVDGDRSTPDITAAEHHASELDHRWCINVGFTYLGLRALGVPDQSLATFPPEFREGMVARAARLGDVGDSAPDHWESGLGEPGIVHLIVTIYGRAPADVEQVADQVLALERGRAFGLVGGRGFDGAVMVEPRTGLRTVHFGYADGISQPRFVGVHDPDCSPDELPFAPLGLVLLGHPSAIPHVHWNVPQPDVLGRNGTFNAFRVMAQDVAAFEEFLSEVSVTHASAGVTPDLVAAKVCGRFRSGDPLITAGPKGLNDFDYDDDPDGETCPIGSHIRRANPRSAHIVQRSTNLTRGLIRRGVPYGPPWDPDDLGTRHAHRGLLGLFLCASLSAQFEAMQYDWINLGLQDPRITGTNDPMIGANDPANSTFVWPRPGAAPLVVRGFQRFVSTRGGAYTFLPTIPGIRWISTQRS